jgi:hypothetical protein
LLDETLYDANDKLVPRRCPIPRYTGKAIGKRECDLLWVAAFLAARVEAILTQRKVNVAGFGGWYVSPVDKEFCKD